MTRAVLFENAAGRITGVSVKGHSGYAEEVLPPGITDKQMEQAQLLFGALRIGFSDIAEQYPAYFRLTIRKVH